MEKVRNANDVQSYAKLAVKIHIEAHQATFNSSQICRMLIKFIFEK